MKVCIHRLALCVGLLAVLQAPAGATCIGDCNGDEKVTVDELVLGVNIVLGALSWDQCPALDPGGPVGVEIDHLASAVGRALYGCPPESGPGDTVPVAQTISLSMTVPDPCWAVTIEEIYRVGDELWVLSFLRRTADICILVLGQAEDSIEVAAPPLPIRYFIEGKTWGWSNPEPYTFIASRDQIQAQLDAGELIFRRP